MYDKTITKEQREQLKLFLSHLFPVGFSGYIEQRPIHHRGVYHKGCHAWESVEALMVHFEKMRAKYLSKRANWYFGVLPRNEEARKRIKIKKGAKKDHILPGWAVWADIDDKQTGSREATMAAVEALSPSPSAIIISGGGAHVYYWLRESTNPQDIERLNRSLLAQCQGDEAAHDCTRILRMPYSWHCKGEPKLVEIQYCSAKKFTVRTLIDIWGEPEPLFSLPVKHKITPTAANVAENMKNLMEKHPKLMDLYEGRGKDGGNTTPSGYDWAFVREGLYLGASEIDVANALWERLHATGRGEKGERYVSLTVSKALARHQARGLHNGSTKRAVSTPRKQKQQAPQPTQAPSLSDGPWLERYPEDYSNKALRGKPHKSLKNCVSIVRWYQKMEKPSIRYNDFQLVEEVAGERMADHLLTKLRLNIANQFGTEFSRDLVKDTFSMVARSKSYHPVQDYLTMLHTRELDGVEGWDGVDRINGEPSFVPFLANYCNVEISPENEELIKNIGRCWLLSCVARAFQPGCKVDTCLILCGAQGAGKGQFFKIMATKLDWYSDNPLDVRGGRDTFSKLRGKWIWEFAELASLKHREAEATKQFISSQSYEYRPAYAHYDISQPAGCVFVGSSNEQEILRDPTGSRRFWPVSVGVIEEERLAKDVEQIWAQAVDIFKREIDEKGRSLWELPPHLWEKLEVNNQSYQATDAWGDVVERWLDNVDYSSNIPNRATEWRLTDILYGALGIEAGKQNKAMSMRLAGLLNGEGWLKVRKRDDKKKYWAWKPPTKD